jgi:hypothetical protein
MSRSPLLILGVAFALAPLASALAGCNGGHKEAVTLSAAEIAANGSAQTIVQEHMAKAKQIAGDSKLSKAKKQEMGKQLATEEVSKLLEVAKSAGR